MKRRLLTLSLLLSMGQVLTPAASAAEPSLVLVASINSTVSAMSVEKVHELYLVAPMFSDGKAIKPLLNYSDSFTQETFMQKVMLMSTQAYERQILARIFRMGGNRPPVYAGLTKLINALKADPTTVSYMYSDEANAHPDIRIVSTLWSKEAEEADE